MSACELIARAVSHFGSQQRLADAIGCSQQLISRMLHNQRPSAEISVQIHAATGGHVSKYDLRPDLFGPEKEGAA